MEKLSYVITKDFVSCVHVRFYFFTAAHFHLAASISHFLTDAMFFFQRNSSPLFSITRSSSFSVIHVGVNIKNNVKKDTTLLLLFFFLSKPPGGRAIFFRCIWVAIPVDWVILDCCACCASVRAVGRTYGHVTPPKFLGCIGYPIFLPMVLCYKSEMSAVSTP